MPKSLYQLSGYKLVPLGLPVHWRRITTKAASSPYIPTRFGVTAWAWWPEALMR
jgi:hypothetical protein